jgi:NAD(P)-dependent dehydrogenase (short-subunit alcohol dehydrogenase family)
MRFRSHVTLHLLRALVNISKIHLFLNKNLKEIEMSMRLDNKIAIVVGAGQTPGETIGNGRAISVLFAREGAKVLLVDSRLDSAQETKTIIDREGGESFAFEADITRTADCHKIAEKCVEAYGRIDILVNVVGILNESRLPLEVTEEQWDTTHNTNLRAMFIICKYVLPVMEKRESGCVINISSGGAICDVGFLAYQTSKAGVNALTHYLALQYAGKGIRANTIMPGALNTPMAIKARSTLSDGIGQEEMIEIRNKAVPLKGGMGDGWDCAYAALFLASDEAKFITAAILPVDGGQLARIG